jgi:hypothetical protein
MSDASSGSAVIREQGQDMSAVIAAAEKRICALPEGRDMIKFLREAGYTVEYKDGLESAAAHDFVNKKIWVQRGVDEDALTAFLPHEIFHAMQYARAPEIARVTAYLGGMTDYKSGEKGQVELAMPADYLWAHAAMEIAAYAVGTDFVCRLASVAGDKAARRAYDRYCRDMSETYDEIMSLRTIKNLAVGTRLIADFGNGVKFVTDAQRGYAAAAASFLWFWSAITKDGPVRLHYQDGAMKGIENNCRRRLAPIFRLAAEGDITFGFRELTRADILKLGEGYSFNPLDVPGFEDIAGPDYRRGFSDANKERIRNIEATMGLG